MRWMLAVPRAIAPPQNLPKNTPRTKVPFCSALRRHKPYLLIIPSKLRPRRDCAGTTRRVGTIEIVAIAAPVAPGLKAPPRLLESIWLRRRLKTIVIVVATGQRNEKIRTWARPPFTTVTRKAILPTNAQSSASQKTSIGLGNLLVGDWC